MSNMFIIIILAISVVSLAISVYLALKMKTISYMLEQPIVKKMSPQLKLKPVKLDELLAERNRQQQPQNRDLRQQGESRNNPRHGTPRNESDRRPDLNRDRQDRRPERGEGDRNRNSDRFRDRDRNRDRSDRPQYGGGERRPREFTDNRESAPSPAPVTQMEPQRSEPPALQEHETPLSPRRPLQATVDAEARSESPTPLIDSEPGPAGFGDGDIQHGRRMQLKKKPRFDETEVKSGE
jgi:hypothetical protein